MIARRAGTIMLLLPAFGLVLGAVDFPKLPAFIPIEVARVEPALVPRLESLNAERADLTQKLKDFDKACGTVAAGTAADQQCAKYFPILSAAVQKHADKSLIFLQAYAAAEAAAKVIAPPIAPKGALPKGVEDAIAGAYRDAGPEVIDRVRRGYQSVQANDWTLAVAWFRDALNRAPGNAGLKSLIALAEAPPPPAPPPPNLQLPKDSDVEFLYPGAAPARQPHVPAPDDVYYYVPSKGYYRMSPDGARVQQLLDAMSGAKPGSIINIR